MKPYVICHMLSSVDGGLHPSRWTQSPDGPRSAWSKAYAAIHDKLDTTAWLVGRVTMAEMTKAGPHAPEAAGSVDRPHHFADRQASTFAIALDQSGKLHFDRPDIDGDHIVVLLGHDVPDNHLAELAADGVSYVVAADEAIDLAAALEVLGRDLGIKRLALEGGAGVNGSFFAAGLVDELSVLIAPALDGGLDSTRIVGSRDGGLADVAELSLTSCERLDVGVVHLRYAVRALPDHKGRPTHS
jgi:riboflavin biosynthesis pyrimidine reductase